MARLPTPGRDSGTWGNILNDFLLQSLKSDGNVKDNAVTASAIAPNAVTTASIAPNAITATELATNAVTATHIADSSITETQLSPTVQTKLNAVSTGTAISDGAVTTAKLADGAVTDAKVSATAAIAQSKIANLTTSLAGKAATTHTHTASQISDSTTVGRAILMALDQATARAAIGAGTSNLVIGTTNTTAKAGDYAPTKSDVGLANVDNTSDASKPVSSATQTALNAKASLASPTFTGTVTTPALLVSGGTPASGKVLTSDTSGNATWQTPSSGFADPTTTKGDIIIRSSSSTTRQAIGGDGQVLTADSTQSTGVKWASAGSSAVSSVAGKTGAVILAESDITNLANDLANKTDKTTLTNKGDLYVANASAVPDRVGVGSDGQVLTADSTQAVGVKWTAPSNANQGYASYVGDGTSGPFTVTHNLNSRDVLVNVYRAGGTYEQVMVRTDRVTPNTVVLRPDEVWTLNQYRVLVGFVAQSDVTAPTAPTVAVTAHTTTSMTVTATGSTDAVGVVSYNWFLNGSFVTNTTVSSYTFSNLDTAASYTFKATTLDFAGNESPASNTLTQSTDTPASIVYDATGSGSFSTAAAALTETTSWTHTVGSGGSRYMIVGIVVSHASWNDPAAYSPFTVTSSLGGTFTRIGYKSIGVGGQWQGSVNLFAVQNPAIGAHTLTASVTAGQSIDRIAANSVSYFNVGSLGTPVSITSSGSSAAMNLSVTSAVNNYVVGLGGFSASPTGFNQSQRYATGSAVNGYGDYMILGDAAGAASVSFTTTSSSIYSAIGVNLIKAGS